MSGMAFRDSLRTCDARKEKRMKMGFAETDITPEMPVTMVGFNRTDNVSRGVLDYLTQLNRDDSLESGF